MIPIQTKEFNINNKFYTSKFYTLDKKKLIYNI